MSAANRANLIAKVQKVCKKHFQSVKPSESRNVFETIIFGCCLEDATFEQAEEGFARLQELYFDWNEVRVTTAKELSEAMVGYHQPLVAATRVKKCLQSIFETHYTFDIDFLKKENLGKAVDKIKNYRGMTSFVVSYVSQSALGGHSLPLGAAEMALMLAAGVITEKEKQKSSVPGLERAIPKSKGVEFFSTMHQLAVPFLVTPNSTKVWSVISEIDSKAKSRFNQRVKEEKAAIKAAEEKKEAAKKKAAEMALMLAAGVITEKEKQKSSVPGLERAIPKSKGVEFFSTMHQLAVPFLVTPNSTKVWSVISEIDSKAKSRFNQRVKEEKAAIKAAEEKKQAAKKKAAEKRAAIEAAAKKASTKKAGGTTSPKKKPASTKKAASVKKSAPTKAATAKKAAVTKKPAAKKPATKKAAAKKPATKKPATKKSAATKKSTKTSKAKTASRSATKRVAKKKPR